MFVKRWFAVQGAPGETAANNASGAEDDAGEDIGGGHEQEDRLAEVPDEINEASSRTRISGERGLRRFSSLKLW